MSPYASLHEYLPGLALTRLGPAQDAGLLVASVPIPPAAADKLSISDHATYVKGLGQWPDSDDNSPRRLLMIADNVHAAPDQLHIGTAHTKPIQSPPSAEMSLFTRSPDPLFMWERHTMRMSWGENTAELAMGLRTCGEIHWWEACRLIITESTPHCVTVEMGGAIPHVEFGKEDMEKYRGYANPFLHKHNWINGHIYARLHANGVCEIYARHTNSKFFDDGLPFDDTVPVIGIKVNGSLPETTAPMGAWDGTVNAFDCGPVKLDVSEASRLATAKQPGSLNEHDDFLVWQPYTGAEMYGGLQPQECTGDPYILRAEDKVFPRGMSRTIRFSLSLSPDRSPTVARYIAPTWWYGACAEFRHTPFLPVFNEFDDTTDGYRKWVSSCIRCGGFEDGSVPRHKLKPPNPHHEPGWEGEMPYAQFLSAWRNQDADEYAGALRSAYHFTDVCVDHSMKLVRMHGYPPHAFALPMARVLGTLAAYLETGHPYLLETAESVIEVSYRLHKNSWPRLAVGRDACFIRGAMMLYRFTDQTYFLKIARDALHDVAESQNEDGAFGDQGGGSGVHQWAAYVVKPWMGLMAVGGALDYLEMFPDDEELLAMIGKFVNWLMAERYDHDGTMGWGYQHYYNGLREHMDQREGGTIQLPGPALWHQDYLARLMMFWTLHTGDPKYYDAWQESFHGKHGTRVGDHRSAQGMQYIPWVQASLIQAALTKKGVEAHPVWLGNGTPREGTFLTPDGPVKMTWCEDGNDVMVDNKSILINPRAITERH